MESRAVIPLTGKEGSVFEYWRQRYAVPLFSRISIQTIDPTAYQTQIKMLEGFLNDMRDLIYTAQEEKLGKSVEYIEKIDARMCMEVSQMVREFNTQLNSVHGLSARHPSLIQNRGRAFKRS